MYLFLDAATLPCQSVRIVATEFTNGRSLARAYSDVAHGISERVRAGVLGFYVRYSSSDGSATPSGQIVVDINPATCRCCRSDYGIGGTNKAHKGNGN